MKWTVSSLFLSYLFYMNRSNLMLQCLNKRLSGRKLRVIERSTRMRAVRLGKRRRLKQESLNYITVRDQGMH